MSPDLIYGSGCLYLLLLFIRVLLHANASYDLGKSLYWVVAIRHSVYDVTYFMPPAGIPFLRTADRALPQGIPCRQPWALISCSICLLTCQ